MYDLEDLRAIERHARALVGRRLGDVTAIAADEQLGNRSRGTVGHHLERYFGLTINSEAGPDFHATGTELKSVPVTPQGNTFTAKERTFITAIDYASIVDAPFDGSSLDTKTRRTLYVFYEWRGGVPVADLRVRRILMHERDELDELALREAYGHVQRMVRAGRAHELSESDTWGVGPATKDARARGVSQPFSEEPAKRRAFAWRPAYTTRLFQVAKLAQEPVVEAPDELTDLIADVRDLLLPHYGRSVAELRDRFVPHVSDTAKSLASTATRALLRAGDAQNLEAFERLGITVRTVRAERTSLRPFESVSFPAFDFLEVADTPWEASPLHEQLNAVLFVVFTADRSQLPRDARLWTAFLWRPAPEDTATMRREYETYRQAIAELPVEEWPQASDTEVLHVRPHGRDKRDRLPLPTGGDHVRSAFWLNRDYVKRLIERSRPL